jgi:BMFP domain-containing protein YqiC
MIQEAKKEFNKTLKYLIENTTYTKIMLVSREEEDLSKEF